MQVPAIELKLFPSIVTVTGKYVIIVTFRGIKFKMSLIISECPGKTSRGIRNKIDNSIFKRFSAEVCNPPVNSYLLWKL